MLEMNAWLMFALIKETMMQTTSPSLNTLTWMAQWHEMEMKAAAELIAPQDRKWVVKICSSNWCKMMFSSRLYFACSMKDLFRIDSGSIATLVKVVCPLLALIKDTSEVACRFSVCAV
ncbi:hypothetical protein PC120_g4445 [Phytophthora cactorum]|nr:hypothetical protein PC120_g4445 [Phytophthora cactorum]